MSSYKEDGTLTGNALSWNSSLNGLFGTGQSIATNALNVGVHSINFTAKDSSGAKALQQINIMVQESTPSVTIFAPPNNSIFYYTQANVTFNGSATDPHEGNINVKMNWTYNVDKNIGGERKGRNVFK